MTPSEQQECLRNMRAASAAFYEAACKINNHPFIEFTGLMNEYIKACDLAHKAGIDFSECSVHSGYELPLRPYQVDYINEKLECIFAGRSVVQVADA
jgi:hypothetical protein